MRISSPDVSIRDPFVRLEDEGRDIVMRLLRHTAIFTIASIALGLGAAHSSRVAALGWLFSTLLASFAGVSFGVRARSEREGTAGGATAAAVSVLFGAGLPMLVGVIGAGALLQAVLFSFVVGAAAGTFAFFAGQGTALASR
jgi:hypothetical protein